LVFWDSCFIHNITVTTLVTILNTSASTYHSTLVSPSVMLL